MKVLSAGVMGIFYTFAGVNHFVNPDFYLPLIPDYLPLHSAINWVSGGMEVILGIGVLYPKSRTLSSKGIIALLIAFIPSHIYFIQQGSCLGELCVSTWIGWIRLILIHPLLILWAYSHAK